MPILFSGYKRAFLITGKAIFFFWLGSKAASLFTLKTRFFLESVSHSVVSRVQLFVTLWIVTCQAPLSKGFSRQEYWSELPFPFPGNLPDPGIKPKSPALQEGSLSSKLPGKSPFHGRTTAKPKTNTQNLVLVYSRSQYKVHIGKKVYESIYFS